MSDYPPIGTLKVKDKQTASEAAAYLVKYTGGEFGDNDDRVFYLAESLADWINAQ